MATSTSLGRATDQAQTPAFKVTLGAQAAAGLVFSLAPLLLTASYASTLGFSGSDHLVYRLGGAATAGYFVAPVVALLWRAGWREIRIPALATLTFTIGALVASLWQFVAGDREPVVPFVIAAGAVFTLIAVYWLVRNEGVDEEAGKPLPDLARLVLGLATLSAATFGLLPLLAPTQFASLFGLAGTDVWVFRLAGAACLGYATGGVASLMAPGYRLIRIQNFAAITFNALGAASAWLAVIHGNGGWLAPVVAAAASFFAVALIVLDRRLAD